MKNAYETQLVQLEELIIQQRKQVHTLKSALDDAQCRFALVLLYLYSNIWIYIDYLFIF